MPDFLVIFNEGLEHIKKCVFIQFQSSSCTCSFSEECRRRPPPFCFVLLSQFKLTLTGLAQTGNLVKYQFEMVS